MLDIGGWGGHSQWFRAVCALAVSRRLLNRTRLCVTWMLLAGSPLRHGCSCWAALLHRASLATTSNVLLRAVCSMLSPFCCLACHGAGLRRTVVCLLVACCLRRPCFFAGCLPKWPTQLHTDVPTWNTSVAKGTPADLSWCDAGVFGVLHIPSPLFHLPPPCTAARPHDIPTLRLFASTLCVCTCVCTCVCVCVCVCVAVCSAHEPNEPAMLSIDTAFDFMRIASSL